MALRSLILSALAASTVLPSATLGLGMAAGSQSDEAQTLRNDIDDFRRGAASLSPDAAARQWLELVRRKCDEPAPRNGFDYDEGAYYLASLPDPKAWPKIEALVDAGWQRGKPRAEGMKMLMAVLQGRDREAWTMLRARRQTGLPFRFADAELELALHMRDPDAIEQAMDDQPIGEAMRGATQIRLPDLFGLLGTERTSRILTKILLNKKAEIEVDWMQMGAYRAQALALKLAKEHVHQLAYPQWTLAESPDAGDLFDQMVKRFPNRLVGVADMNPPTWTTNQGAAITRLAILWLAGDVSGARQFAVSHESLLNYGLFGARENDDLVRRLGETGKFDAFGHFLGDLAEAYPASNFPSLFLSFAKDELPPAYVEAVTRACDGKNKASDARQIKEALVASLLRQGKYAEAADELVKEPDIASYHFGLGGAQPVFRHLAEILHRPDLSKLGLSQTEFPERVEWEAAEAKRLDAFGPAGKAFAKARELGDEHLDQWAKSEYRRALELNPHLAPASFGLGQLEVRDGDYVQGTKHLDQAMRNLPTDTRNLGADGINPWTGTLKADKTIRDSLQAVIASGTRNPSVYVCAAEWARTSGDEDSMTRDYQKAVEIDPNCFDAWLALVYEPLRIPRDLHTRAFVNCIRLGMGDTGYAGSPVYDYAAIWHAMAALSPRPPGMPDPKHSNSDNELPHRYRWIGVDPLIVAIDRLVRSAD